MSPNLQAVPVQRNLPEVVDFTVRGLLDLGREALSNLDAHEAEAVSECFLCERLRCSRTELYLDLSREVAVQDAAQIVDWMNQRRQGMPTAYVLRKAYFWDLELSVGPGCLVPRPETEILVESVMRLTGFAKDAPVYFADLGAGSGAISIALLRYFINGHAELFEISDEAGKFTLENLKRYGLESRAQLRREDGFLEILPSGGREWDLLVSNPPYLSKGDLENLEPEVQWEPQAALDGGSQGLDFYFNMIDRSTRFLKCGGWMVMELGKDQSPAVRDKVKSSGRFQEPLLISDYLGIERVLMAQKNQQE